MARKTVKIEDLKIKINELLANSEIGQDEKKGFCTLLEIFLMDTDNYRGFQNIHWLNGGFDQWVIDGRPDFPEKEKYMTPKYDRIYL